MQVARPVGGDTSNFGCWYLSLAKREKNGKRERGTWGELGRELEDLSSSDK